MKHLRRSGLALLVTLVVLAPALLFRPHARLVSPPARYRLRADRTSEPTWLIPHWNTPARGSSLPSPAWLERGRG